MIGKKSTPHNSTYPKGGFSWSKDSFVVNQTLVFRIKFCGKSPALRVAAKRYEPVVSEIPQTIFIEFEISFSQENHSMQEKKIDI